jgi:hypothetical protein
LTFPSILEKKKEKRKESACFEIQKRKNIERRVSSNAAKVLAAAGIL